MENEKKEQTKELTTTAGAKKPEQITIPYKTNREAVLYTLYSLTNPSPERLMENAPIPKYMIASMVYSIVRERAADLSRDTEKEPLSGVARLATLQCLRGVGMQAAMLAGNLIMGGLSQEGESNTPKWSREV